MNNIKYIKTNIYIKLITRTITSTSIISTAIVVTILKSCEGFIK